MSEWEVKPLAELADIKVSNVDKKSMPGELSVRLCNYMDVYAGRYLGNGDRYMDATCTTRELAAFGLRRGDVLITKDSESPDDIAIPALIDDDVQELVCGYHLAVLRLRSDALDPVVLLKQLESERLHRYFGQRAGGSTRYGLSTRAIAQAPILVPPQEAQRSIVETHRSLDTQITHTEALIAKQEQVRAGLMQDLLTRGVDETGRLRPPREEAPELYHETALGWLPIEWCTPLLDSVAKRASGHTPSRTEPTYWNGGIKWVSLADSHRLDQGFIHKTEHEISPAGLRNSSAQMLPSGTVILSRDAGVGKSAILSADMAVSQHFMAWICGSRLDNLFLYYYLQHAKRTFENIALGSTILTIGLRFFKNLCVPLPPDDEQRIISATLHTSEKARDGLAAELKKLRHLRTALLRDLLTPPASAVTVPRIAAE